MLNAAWTGSSSKRGTGDAGPAGQVRPFDHRAEEFRAGRNVQREHHAADGVHQAQPSRFIGFA